MEYILVKCDKRNMGEDVIRYCFYQISDLFYYYICQKVVKLIIVCIGLPYYWLCWWRELRSAESCYLYICSLSGQLSLHALYSQKKVFLEIFTFILTPTPVHFSFKNRHDWLHWRVPLCICFIPTENEYNCQSDNKTLEASQYYAKDS